MGIGNWLFEARKQPPDIADFWYLDQPLFQTGFMNNVVGGQVVTPDTAMRQAAVYACVRILGGTLGMLPCVTYKIAEKDGYISKERDRSFSTFNLLFRKPNEYQSSFDFFYDLTTQIAIRGWGLAEKIPGRRGSIEQLWPIHPHYCHLDWLDRKSSRQRIFDISSGHDGRSRVLVDDQVIFPHLLSLDYEGLWPTSPISLAGQGVGVAMALETHSARFFDQGTMVSGFLSSDKPYDPKADEALKKNWKDAYSGLDNMWKVAALWGGMKWNSMSLSAVDSQLLEHRSWQVVDIARIYGIPTWMLQAQEKNTAWGTGIEQMGLAFVTYTLGPWLAMWERELDIKVTRDENWSAQFDTKALMRGDLNSRFDAFQKAINANDPWLLVNEIREDLGLPPVEGGDERRLPLNTTGGSTQNMQETTVPPREGNGQSAEIRT